MKKTKYPGLLGLALLVGCASTDLRPTQEWTVVETDRPGTVTVTCTWELGGDLCEFSPNALIPVLESQPTALSAAVHACAQLGNDQAVPVGRFNREVLRGNRYRDLAARYRMSYVCR